MTTKGSIKVGNKSFYLQSDSQPQTATAWIRQALKAKPRTVREFIVAINTAADFDWAAEELNPNDRFFDSAAEEYRWLVNLRDRTFKLDKDHRARHLDRAERAWKSTTRQKK